MKNKKFFADMYSKERKDCVADRATTNILLHYGELALKCGNRGWFEDKLINSIRANLCGLDVRSIDNLYGRIFIDFNRQYSVKALSDRLCRIFGVVSYAPTVVASPIPDDIERKALSCLDGRQFSTIAVRARRVDKNLPYSSQQINEMVGSAIVRSFDGVTVNLDNPQTTVWIEILSDRAYIYIDKFTGAGGLPTGTGGRVASLISGGIDSPVAAWRMMRRGCLVDFIHFHSAPFTDKASIDKVKEIVGILSGWECGGAGLAMVPLGGIQKKIVTAANEKYRVILYRRFMMRIASILAREYKSEALVTGEALGQVASQTLSNMTTVAAAAAMPVLRPLIGFDKQEIVDLARKIGTYDLSIIPHRDCCQFLEPRYPVTRTTIAEVEDVERRLDVEGLVKEGLTGVEWNNISG